MAETFLERVRRNITKEPGASVAGTAISALVFAQTNPEAFKMGLKMLALAHGKPAVKATLKAIVEAALED